MLFRIVGFCWKQSLLFDYVQWASKETVHSKKFMLKNYWYLYYKIVSLLVYNKKKNKENTRQIRNIMKFFRALSLILEKQTTVIWPIYKCNASKVTFRKRNEKCDDCQLFYISVGGRRIALQTFNCSEDSS